MCVAEGGGGDRESFLYFFFSSPSATVRLNGLINGD